MAVRLWVRRAASPDARSEGDDGVHYEFEQPRLVIGRSPSADLRLPAVTVSDLHATLEATERGYALCDMRSTNGTRVNGAALVPDRPRALHDGDRLEVGEFLIEFQTGGPVRGLTSPERTVSLAKRLLRESLGSPTPEAPTLCWRWADGEPQRLPLPAPPARLLLGSAPDADLHVEGPTAADAMLELEVNLDGLRVRAATGCELSVNGKATRERLLRDGDRARCGEAEVALEDPADRALRALEGQQDAPLERTAQAPATPAPGPEAAPSADAPQAREAEASHGPPSTPAARKRPSLGPDAVVYALALLVLAASAVGMVWLLGG